MTTFAALKTLVSKDLRDPDHETFDATAIGDIINAALAEIGRIAPSRFQEDITPSANVMEYRLRAASATTPVTGVAATNLLTAVDHRLSADQSVRFLTLTGGDGLSVGTSYYVLSAGLTADVFAVSGTVGGSAIDFTTDITDGTFVQEGFDAAIPEIELVRVELWDYAQTPPKALALVAPADGEYSNYSDVGWKVWDGILYLPRPTVQFLATGEYIIRVWGYGPYSPLILDEDLVGLSNEREMALRAYCRVEALQRLVAERDLFSQWQTRSDNKDMTPAALMNGMNLAMDDWRRRSRQIAVLREAP